MSIGLHLLGKPHATAPNGAALTLPMKAYALLARLACDRPGAALSRRGAARFLWENSDAATAATNLRKLLSRIRRTQGDGNCRILIEDKGSIRLSAHVQVDVHLLKEFANERLRINLTHLCDTYRGELLESIPDIGGTFALWLSAERELQRARFASVLGRQIEPFPANPDTAQLIRAARQLLNVEPFSEVAYRTLMRLETRSGRRDRAVALMRDLELRLSKELSVQPEPATMALFREIDASRPQARPPTTRPVDMPPATEAVTPEIPRISILMPAQYADSSEHAVACALVDDVTVGLCRFRALTVLAPHTAWHLSSLGREAPSFEDLRLDYVVETRLKRLGGAKSLSVKLFAVYSREIVWADQFVFETECSSAYYHELSTRIVTALIGRVEHSELGRYDRLQHPTAYRWYLEGKRHLNILDLVSVRRARHAFKQALAAFPDFVPALSGLARVYQQEWLLLARGDPSLLEEAQRLAARAVDIDPGDARGHREQGICGLYLRRYDDSLAAYSTAALLNPQYADQLADHADALVHAGDIGEAFRQISRAIELNPLCPDGYWWTLGGASYLAGDYRAAIRSIERMKHPAAARQLQAASHAMLGEQDLAEVCARKAREVHPNFSVAHWMTIVPFRDRERIHHYEDGLRRAGFT